jgi:hypothetical protein
MRLKHYIIGMAVIAIGCVSCTITSHSVGDNPVGSKIGRKNAWQGNTMDYSFKTAANEANITKIGTVERRQMVFFSVRYTTIVTGE